MAASDRRKRASEEAAAWWVRLQTEELPRAEREQFVDWLRESAVHVAEMLRVAKVHGALEQFQRWAHVSTDGADEDNIVSLLISSSVTGRATPSIDMKGESDASGPPPPAPSPFRQRLRLYALAASFTAIVIAAAWPLIGLRGQTIQTERGERREVALADGSVVAVDPETRLRVKFEEHTRRVLLERGRALFRVAKNADRPFLVQADGTIVRAVGTAFGVERQKQSIKVTVAEGKVAVFQTESTQPPPGLGDNSNTYQPRNTATENPGTEILPRAHPRTESNGDRKFAPRLTAEVLLTAGEQVTMQSSGSAEPVRKVDSDRKLAWAKGRLDFDNETVATAVEEFNRYNRVQLHVVDDALAKRPVSGIFDASDPESFIAFIQTVAAVRVARGDATDITLSMATASTGKPVMK
jgi:transmembrane sensor